MNRQSLIDAIGRVAGGYLLLHLHFNLGTLNILPNWLGYLLMLNALPAIAEYEPSANLLRPLGILLALWEGFLWLIALFGASVNVYFVETVAAVVGLYFHFQLLTNLASVAERDRCPEHRRILTLRTVRTVLMTLMFLPFPWETNQLLAWPVIIVHVIVALWIATTLFSLKRSEAALLDTENSGGA